MASPTPQKSTTQISAFKAAQSRYRRRPQTQEDYQTLRSEVIDFSNPHNHPSNFPISSILPSKLDSFTPQSCSVFESCSVAPPTKAYTLPDIPGVVYFPQAIPNILQVELAHRCLKEYCEPPHVTNIDCLSSSKSTSSSTSNSSSSTLKHLPCDCSMWNQWKDEQSKYSHIHSPAKKLTMSKSNHLKNLSKLSWSTMGYHYDWTVRTYRDDFQSPVPVPVQTLAQFYAQVYFHTTSISTSNSTTFDPTACIINYYKPKSIMGGHSDNLEYTFDKPVISISIGRAAIFLLGGKNKEEYPVVPILIRSGDVLVLGGDSRLNYHGMARVWTEEELQTFDALACRRKDDENVSPWDIEEEKLTLDARSDWRYIQLYLSNHRINVNVRQVLPDGVSSIAEIGQRQEKDVEMRKSGKEECKEWEQRKKAKRNEDGV